MTRPREGECKAAAPVIGLITAGSAILGGLIKFKKEVETGMDCLVFSGFGFVGFMYGGYGIVFRLVIALFFLDERGWV